MTHVQIDDDFFDHPKVLSVGKDAKILSLAAICYSGNMLTDGFIPSGAVLVLAAKTGVRNAKPAIDELIAARLWETTEGGYRVHDYLEYNTSSEKVRAIRDAARERARRNRSQDVRENFTGTSGEVREPTTTTTTEGSLEPNGSQEPLTIPSDDGPPPPKLGDNAPPQPYDLLEELCEAIGSEPSVLSERDKNRQLGVAKRLVDGGMTRGELRSLVGWLQSQSWLTGGIDFFLIEKQISKWRMNGKPIGPPGELQLPPGVKIDDLLEARARKAKHAWVPPERLELLERFGDRLPPMAGD